MMLHGRSNLRKPNILLHYGYKSISVRQLCLHVRKQPCKCSASRRDSNCLTGRNSKKHQSLGSTTFTGGPLILDEDFESAINSLEASTASIEKQCKLLEAQKKVLQEIQARNASTQAETTRAQRSSKSSREKGQADFETSELAESLHTRVERSLKQSESVADGIHSTVERLLEKDDRLLDGLQKVLSQLADAAADSDSSDEVEGLCQALAVYSSAEIHARIDTAFHTATQTKENGKHPNCTHSPSTTSSQGDTLRVELEELCREIDGLSTMAVDAQYRSPITKAIEAAKSQSNDGKAQWMRYMRDILQYLTARLGAVEDGAMQLRSQDSALKTVSTALDGVLAITVDRKSTLQNISQLPSKASQKGLKPLRLVQANLSESQDPAAQLLRHLDVRVADSRDSAQLAESLGAALEDKTKKLAALSMRTEVVVTDQVSRSIAKADANCQALQLGVYTYSPFDTINLVSSDITEGIDGLEKKTQSLSDIMRELNVDGIGSVVREKQKALLNS